MNNLEIYLDKCVGCGLCLKSCSYGALDIIQKKAVVNDNCVLCGVCVESCPFKALEIRRKSVQGDLSEYSGIWVFAEQKKGVVLQVALELLGKAQELAQKRNCLVTALLFGDNIRSEADKLLAFGADRVFLCQDPSFAFNLDEDYIDVLDELIKEHKPETVLFGATGFGRSIAPRVAARVSTGLTADCTILEIDANTGNLEQTRPAFGGNLMATIICPNHRPQMATVRPGVMQITKREKPCIGEIVEIAAKENIIRKVELLENALSDNSESIAGAKVIISVGRGISSQKNLKLVYQLAEKLGAAVGCTRPLVDMGWCEYKHQIGQTGVSVSPELLITFGISGAIQHLAGIGNAKKVIAVNSDPDAPIFQVSHYKVVGDCVEIIKELLRTVIS